MSWLQIPPPFDAEILWSLPSEPQEGMFVPGSRVLVMGSGSGSNFEALVTALRPFGVEFAGLFCDRKDAGILKRAERLEVPIFPLTEPERSSKRLLNDAVLRFLEQPHSLVALAGYMRILPARVVSPNLGRILNLHPSLLPEFPGLNSIQRAYDSTVRKTGISIHWANEEVDAGPLLAQGRLLIDRSKPVEHLEEQIHQLEHWLYPRVVLQILWHRTQVTMQ
jgi:phosphoribosylglycinamide formyltransferase-1